MLEAVKRTAKKYGKYSVYIFFAALLLTGVTASKDYGLSWDEPISRTNGIYAYNHLVFGDQSIYDYRDRYYGIAFELPLIFLERAFGLNDLRQVYFMRHLANFLLFYAGVVFFYLLCRYFFKSWQAGLMGAVFLVLSPRIFADAFYNSKDLAFMAAFIIAAYTLVRMLGERKWKWVVFHSLATAFLIDIRIMGLMIPVFTAVLLGADILFDMKDTKRTLLTLWHLFLYFLLASLFVVLFWPILWEDPAKYLLETVKQMGKFPWEGMVLYRGEYVNATKIPWHYIPVWITISTPIVYLVFFVVGIGAFLFSIFARPISALQNKKNELFFLLWCFTPLVMVIALKSVLYDAWRHLFFIYPAFLIIAVAAPVYVYRSCKKNVILRAVVFSLISAAVIFDLYGVVKFMVVNHPYQNIYFNSFAGTDMEEIKNKYELDYWGLSYRKALEYIVKNDKRDKIKVLGAADPAQYNAAMLLPEERARLEFVSDQKDADYFVSNYRWHREDYPKEIKEVFFIRVGNAKLISVFKLK